MADGNSHRAVLPATVRGQVPVLWALLSVVTLFVVLLVPTPANAQSDDEAIDCGPGSRTVLVSEVSGLRDACEFERVTGDCADETNTVSAASRSVIVVDESYASLPTDAETTVEIVEALSAINCGDIDCESTRVVSVGEAEFLEEVCSFSRPGENCTSDVTYQEFGTLAPAPADASGEPMVRVGVDIQLIGPCVVTPTAVPPSDSGGGDLSPGESTAATATALPAVVVTATPQPAVVVVATAAPAVVVEAPRASTSVTTTPVSPTAAVGTGVSPSVAPVPSRSSSFGFTVATTAPVTSKKAPVVAFTG